MSEVPILMYHEVVSRDALTSMTGRIQLGYLADAEQFEGHLRMLRSVGAVAVSLEQVVDWIRDGKPLPDHAVVITFDDGYAGNHTTALPLLERYGMQATFFVATNHIGDALMMTWEQVRDLASRGMAVESHTASHPLLSTLSADETYRELATSKQAIEERVGRPVRFVSLPNGDSNEAYPALARRAGYLGGCGSEFGCNDRGTDPYFLRRIAIKRHTTPANIAEYMRHDSLGYRWAIGKARAKRVLPALIGKRRYDRLYNAVFGVKEQRKGSAE